MPKEKSKTDLPKAIEGDLQARLIKLREDAGFDMPQMAAGLCLSQDVIINLENENFDLLPEPPYVRGYLRTYAKLGDDDPSELINCYESLRGADADELNFQIRSADTLNPKKNMSPVLGQIIALTVFIAILILIYLIPPVNQWVSKTWQSFSSQVEPTDAEGNPSLLGQLPIPAPLPNNNQDTINEETPSSQANSNQGNLFEEETTETLNTDTDNVEPEVTEVNALNLNSESTETNEIVTETIETAEDTQNNNEEQNTPVEETTTNDSNDSIKVRLVFNKEVWMRIKDKDNETVFEGLNKAETEQTIELQKPLTFRVGNAQGLSLFIDDQPTDITTYINGSIANFTLE